MMNSQLKENYNLRTLNGALHVIVRDVRTNEIVQDSIQQNIIKVFAKEIISHSIVPNNIWDVNSSNWIPVDINTEIYRPRYIALGGSFDESGAPTSGLDSRFYENDPIAGGFRPITLSPGATDGGGLINPVPISAPSRPLKRIERIYFEPSYQPAGSPFLNDDVRALNNVVVFQTTLLANEYNGLTTSDSFLTITEAGLIGAPEQPVLGACECAPRKIFLKGDSNELAFRALASDGATVTLDPSVVNVNDIVEGNQIKIVAPDSDTETEDVLNQHNPYYLVLNKSQGGHDITLDRVPTSLGNRPLNGPIGIFQDNFRMFSHRILASPVKKSVNFEVELRWIVTFA